MDDSYVRIGIVTKPHGVKGEVKVIPTTDSLSRFREVKKVVLTKGNEELPCEIESVKYQNDRVIVKLSILHSMDEAESKRDGEIWISKADSPCKENEYFIGDLIGLSAFREDETKIGTIKDVLETGANDVFLIEQESGTLMVPLISDCIVKVCPEEKKIILRLLPGLEEACTSR